MAYKMLKYIQRTSGYFRKITSDGTSLTMYPDAAFAPSSSRSQTGWVIYYGGTPVLWRSSRQSTTALSTAEAESNAILEGSIAMLGIEAMLLDVSEEIHEQLIGARAVTAGRRADAESRKMKDGVSYVKGGSIQALVALVCRLLVVSTEASTVEVKQKLELDWDMVSVMAVLLLGGLVC
eukprot:s1232_g17.t2